jgi:hypothetical protein
VENPGFDGKHGFRGAPDCCVCHALRTASRPGDATRLSSPTGPEGDEFRVSRGGSRLRRPGTGLERRRLARRAAKRKTPPAQRQRGSWAAGQLGSWAAENIYHGARTPAPPTSGPSPASRQSGSQAVRQSGNPAQLGHCRIEVEYYLAVQRCRGAVASRVRR